MNIGALCIMGKLTIDFYKRSFLEVAKDLVGKILVYNAGDTVYKGRIVETEGYGSEIDEASHAYIGKTKRNEVMFQEGGKLYVYFIYGMYNCSNVVTGVEGTGEAVLLRAVEPLEGIGQMKYNLWGNKDTGRGNEIICNGPGKLCKAFNIKRDMNGESLLGDIIYIHDDGYEPEIGCSKRVGIRKSTELQWRFFMQCNKFVS